MAGIRATVRPRRLLVTRVTGGLRVAVRGWGGGAAGGGPAAAAAGPVLPGGGVSVPPGTYDEAHTGASIDFGTAGPAAAVLSMHLAALGGGVSAAVTLEGSADGSTWAAVSGVSLTASASGSHSLAFTRLTRYLRAVLAPAGGEVTASAAVASGGTGSNQAGQSVPPGTYDEAYAGGWVDLGGAGGRVAAEVLLAALGGGVTCTAVLESSPDRTTATAVPNATFPTPLSAGRSAVYFDPPARWCRVRLTPSGGEVAASAAVGRHLADPPAARSTLGLAAVASTGSAADLTGPTLAAAVTASSLTSLGTLESLAVQPAAAVATPLRVRGSNGSSRVAADLTDTQTAVVVDTHGASGDSYNARVQWQLGGNPLWSVNTANATGYLFVLDRHGAGAAWAVSHSTLRTAFGAAFEAAGVVHAAARAAADPVVVAQGTGSQTGDLVQTRDAGGAVLTRVRPGGGVRLVAQSDAAAEADTLYYSTTAGKPAYKDAAGTVFPLY